MTFLNQITIKTDVEKEKFFRYVLGMEMQVDTNWTCIQTAGQTESQVYCKCTQVHSCMMTQVAKKAAILMLLHALQLLLFSTRGKQKTCVDLHWVAKRWKTWLRLLMLKFDLDQSEHKSSQVNASAHKPSQTKSQVNVSWKLASTCISVWPGLNGGLPLG